MSDREPRSAPDIGDVRTGLSAEAQIKLEDDHNRQCVSYARQNLGL